MDALDVGTEVVDCVSLVTPRIGTMESAGFGSGVQHNRVSIVGPNLGGRPR